MYIYIYIYTCYSKILQKQVPKHNLVFGGETRVFNGIRKIRCCTAFNRVLYGFCTGFRKQRQVLQPKAWCSTSSRCKAFFFFCPPHFCVGSSATRYMFVFACTCTSGLFLRSEAGSLCVYVRLAPGQRLNETVRLRHPTAISRTGKWPVACVQRTSTAWDACCTCGSSQT